MLEFLVTALQALLSKLGNYLCEEACLVWKFKEDLEQLEKTLKDSLRPVEPTTTAPSEWLQRIRDVAYCTEDVLDEFRYKMLQQQAESNSKLISLVRFIDLKLSYPLYRYRVARKFRELQDIHAGSIQTTQQGSANHSELNFYRRETHGVLGTSERVIGREAEASEITEWFLNSSNPSVTLHVVSVVGMAGLGKTYLAKEVRKRLKESKSFDHTIWICVSHAFKEKRILKEMLENVDPNAARLENMDMIVRSFKEKFADKRFLLILDDVWEVEESKWQSLKESLCSAGQHNCVLVTTRFETVAKTMESSELCKPKPLADSECWKIIKSKAFGDESVEEELEETGLKVAEKCFGLPLIASVVGGMMKQKKAKAEWEKILKDKAWGGLATPSKDIEPILRLSYDHLPSASHKQCFAYCAIFPKDTVMMKEELVQLWISQGYLEETREKSKRKIGHDHFDHLVASSLLQDVVEYVFNLTTCKMHDALHDLAYKVSQPELWNLEEEIPKDVSNLRLLNIGTRKEMLETIKKDDSLRKIRTLVAEGDACEGKAWDLLKGLRALMVGRGSVGKVGRSKSLKYLEIKGDGYSNYPRIENTTWKRITELYLLECLICRFVMLPRELEGIGNLSNLRYLDLSMSKDVEILPECVGNLLNLEVLNVSWTSISGLPESIGKLLNLEVLNVSCTKIKRLPDSITKLRKLEIIDIRHCSDFEGFPKGVENLCSLKKIQYGGLVRMPAFIGRLTSLEELSCFQVRNEDGCDIGELSRLNNLKGFLCIEGLENVRNNVQAMMANLEEKSGLDALVLRFKDPIICFNEGKVECDYEGVLQGLTPPTNIRRLSLHGYRGMQMREWLMDMGRLSKLESLNIAKGRFVKKGEMHAKLFPSLKELRLTYVKLSAECMLKEILPSDFHALSSLDIVRCDKLKGIAGEFPSLASLSVRGCPEFEEISGEFPSLWSLSVDDCPEFEEISGEFPSLVDMEISKCGKLTCLSNMKCVKSLHSFCNLWNGVSSLPTWLEECKSLHLDVECLEYFEIGSEFRESSLSSLGLRFSKEIQEIPLSFLRAPGLRYIRDLVFKRGRELTKTLPSEMPIFTGLRNFTISEFSVLEVLPEWRDNFPSLKCLRIEDCFKLKNLPSRQCVQHLEELHISWCRELKENCKEGGTEWPKISGIPRLEIG